MPKSDFFGGQPMKRSPLGGVFVPLSTGPYRAWESGVKTVEIRQLSPRWHLGVVPPGRGVVLSRGYSTPDRMQGVVVRAVEASTWDDLPEWARMGSDVDAPYESPYFDAFRPLLAFQVRVAGVHDAKK